MSPTKLKARPIDNKNKMPHSFKLRMKILTTKPTEICYFMYPVPIILYHNTVNIRSNMLVKTKISPGH